MKRSRNNNGDDEPNEDYYRRKYAESLAQDDPDKAKWLDEFLKDLDIDKLLDELLIRASDTSNSIGEPRLSIDEDIDTIRQLGIPINSKLEIIKLKYPRFYRNYLVLGNIVRNFFPQPLHYNLDSIDDMVLNRAQFLHQDDRSFWDDNVLSDLNNPTINPIDLLLIFLPEAVIYYPKSWYDALIWYRQNVDPNIRVDAQFWQYRIENVIIPRFMYNENHQLWDALYPRFTPGELVRSGYIQNDVSELIRRNIGGGGLFF